MVNRYFDEYFHEVLLNDEEYLDLCEKLADLCMMNVKKDYVEFSIEDEEKYQRLEKLRRLREDYILNACKKLYKRKN